jgi:exonuclease III
MPSLKLVSWNMQHQVANWNEVLSTGVDVALLQEAKAPPSKLAKNMVMDIDFGHREARLTGSAAVAGLSNRVEFTPIPTQPLGGESRDAIMVSRPGTFAPAIVRILETDEEVVVVSIYATWANPSNYTESNWIYADASAHRLISDLSALIGHQNNHKIIVAGDLNILHGYGEHGSPYWKKRYDTAFGRMEALGLKFVGPQAPEGGKEAYPKPEELPSDSRNVPTYRTNKGKPETATRQLDFVFASESIASRLSVRAANSVAEWGSSDHCKVFIELS